MRRVAPTILLVLALAASAAAHHTGVPTVDHYVEPDGSGRLIANPGGHELVWERCRPDGRCERLDHRDQLLETGDPEPGTTFVATQDGTSVRSQSWQGLVRATAPPRLEGEPAVGALVRPLAAAWEGGWGREGDWLQLQMCRTAQGGGCVVLVDEIKYGRCEPGGGRYVPSAALGRWLRVVDVRVARDAPFTSEGYFAPEGVRPNQPGGSGVAVAAFGPVRPGRPRAGGCPGEPRVQVRRRASVPHPAFGTVTCGGSCRLELRVRQRGRTLRRRAIVRGYGMLVLEDADQRRMRPGRAHVRVRVDGRKLASRTVSLRAPRADPS